MVETELGVEISKIKHLGPKQHCYGPSRSKIESFWCIRGFII